MPLKPHHDDISADHRRALQLLDSWPNGCPEGLMIEEGYSVEFIVDLIQKRLATLHTQYMRIGRCLMETVRLKITAAGRQSLAATALC
jgi:hypothetical protein